MAALLRQARERQAAEAARCRRRRRGCLAVAVAVVVPLGLARGWLFGSIVERRCCCGALVLGLEGIEDVLGEVEDCEKRAVSRWGGEMCRRDLPGLGKIP